MSVKAARHTRLSVSKVIDTLDGERNTFVVFQRDKVTSFITQRLDV
jgi:hypothetical protein